MYRKKIAFISFFNISSQLQRETANSQWGSILLFIHFKLNITKTGGKGAGHNL